MAAVKGGGGTRGRPPKASIAPHQTYDYETYELEAPDGELGVLPISTRRKDLNAEGTARLAQVRDVGFLFARVHAAVSAGASFQAEVRGCPSDACQACGLLLLGQ